MKAGALGRRSLLRGGLALGAGLTIGFRLPAGRTGSAQAETAAGVFAPNQWLSSIATGS